jgi:hypothetical protein
MGGICVLLKCLQRYVLEIEFQCPAKHPKGRTKCGGFWKNPESRTLPPITRGAAQLQREEQELVSDGTHRRS